ncbi:hypothetical protein IAT38_001227 [Cryptococcus sp. DSM 104549]
MPTSTGTLNATASTSTAHRQPAQAVRHRHDRHPPLATHPDTQPQPQPAPRPARRRRRNATKPRSLRWRKGVVTEAFRKFGEHCARNQIRTLLIDCLVMTNLFYPSLALYLEKKFPPLRPPSPPAHNTHRISLRTPSGTLLRPLREHPLSLLSTPILDSFFPYPPPLLPRLSWAGWWGRDPDQMEDEGWGVSRAVPGEADAWLGHGEQVRMVRVGWADVADVLDRDVEAGEAEWDERDRQFLRLVRDIADTWETRDDTPPDQGCVRQLPTYAGEDDVDTPPPPCYILSPAAYSPASDVPLVSVSSLSHVAPSAPGPGDLPLGWAAGAGNMYHSAAVLFHVPRNTSGEFEERWEGAIAEAARQVEGEVFVEAVGPRAGNGDQTGEWLVSYHPASSTPPHPTPDTPTPSPETISSPPTLICILYVVLFATLIIQLSNASKAHSRFGLAFTGVVQLCCSAVMSISVLALLGWNGWGVSTSESSLPTYLLPFVIVVVGAENMSTLTQAIFSIPFTHSVPVRIGLGLSKVGTTIALTSLTDLALLGVVWLCVNLQPVREFCLFAAVVIVTDWFMLHTFFLTVLSIDAQRLELADVLASNKVGPTTPVENESVADAQAEKQGGFNWRRLLRARTTKSGSLLLLLFTVGLLYWLAQRHSAPLNNTASLYGYTPTPRSSSSFHFPTPTPTPFHTTPADLPHLSPADKFWRALNPHGWPFIRVVVPPASLIVLPKTGHHMLPKDIRKLSLPTSRLVLPRLKPLFYLFKVVVLPQAVTAFALYALCLYLLKDADLLDAQRDRLGRVDDRGEESESPGSAKSKSKFGTTSLGGALRAHMLPCSHESDVDLIAASPDGRLALSVGTGNTLCLWRFADPPASGAGTREPLQPGGLGEEEGVVVAGVSADRRWVVVVGCLASRGSEGGAGAVVQVWEVPEEGAVTALPVWRAEQPSAGRVVGVAFDEGECVVDDPFLAPRGAGVSEPGASAKNVGAGVGLGVLLACADGAVVLVGPAEGVAKTVIPPQSLGDGPPCRVQFMRSEGTASNAATLSILVAGQHDIHLWRKTPTGWTSSILATNLPSSDPITSLSTSNPSLPGVFAVGRKSGAVDVYDDAYGPLGLAPPTPTLGGVRKVEIVRPQIMRCTGCGQQTQDGYLVVSSTSSQVFIDRISPRAPLPSFCRCRRASSIDDVPGLLHPSDSPAGRTRPQALVVPPQAGRGRYAGGSPHKTMGMLSPVSNGDFPLSSHGGARRPSNIHREDDGLGVGPGGGVSAGASPHDRAPSSITMTSSLGTGGGASSPGGELDVQPLGSVTTDHSGDAPWAVLHGEFLVGVRRGREGIDDAQWQVWAVDLGSPWDGAGLVVEAVDLPELVRRTLDAERLAPSSTTSSETISLADRRAERLLSLNGRASFPPRVGSFSVPTHPALGYVEVRAMGKLGGGAAVAGFGNRLGVVGVVGAGVGGRGEGGRGEAGKRVVKPRSSFEGGLGAGLGTTPTQKRMFPLTPPPPPPPVRRLETPTPMNGVGNGGAWSGGKKIE